MERRMNEIQLKNFKSFNLLTAEVNKIMATALQGPIVQPISNNNSKFNQTDIAEFNPLKRNSSKVSILKYPHVMWSWILNFQIALAMSKPLINSMIIKLKENLGLSLSLRASNNDEFSSLFIQMLVSWGFLSDIGVNR